MRGVMHRKLLMSTSMMRSSGLYLLSHAADCTRAVGTHRILLHALEGHQLQLCVLVPRVAHSLR